MYLVSNPCISPSTASKLKQRCLPCAEEVRSQQAAGPAPQVDAVAGSTRQYLNDSLQQQPMPEPFEPEE